MIVSKDNSLQKMLGDAAQQLSSRKNHVAPYYAATIALLALISTILFLDIHQTNFLAIHHSLKNLMPEFLWVAITRFGDERVLILIAVFFVWRRPEIFWAMLVSALIAVVISRGLKHFFDLARPPAILGTALNTIGPALKQQSFPSGHTVTAFVFFTSLGWFAKTKLLFAGAITAGVLVGLSRIALGVHWPLDIVAGAASGILSASLGYMIAQKWHWGLKPFPFRVLLLLPWVAALTALNSNSGNPDSPWLIIPLMACSLFYWVFQTIRHCTYCWSSA
jgi:membrane-associated phospholipid phosphatase